jgi:hypothetical protein
MLDMRLQILAIVPELTLTPILASDLELIKEKFVANITSIFLPALENASQLSTIDRNSWLLVDFVLLVHGAGRSVTTIGAYKNHLTVSCTILVLKACYCTIVLYMLPSILAPEEASIQGVTKLCG